MFQAVLYWRILDLTMDKFIKECEVEIKHSPEDQDLLICTSKFLDWVEKCLESSKNIKEGIIRKRQSAKQYGRLKQMIEKHKDEMPKPDPNVRPIPKRKTWREDLADKYLKPKGYDERWGGKEDSDWVDVDSSGDDVINEGG